MSRAAASRLRKLETVASPRRMVIVFGRSHADQDRHITALKASGLSGDADQFVSLALFSDVLDLPPIIG